MAATARKPQLYFLWITQNQNLSGSFSKLVYQRVSSAKYEEISDFSLEVNYCGLNLLQVFIARGVIKDLKERLYLGECSV